MCCPSLYFYTVLIVLSGKSFLINLKPYICPSMYCYVTGTSPCLLWITAYTCPFIEPNMINRFLVSPQHPHETAFIPILKIRPRFHTWRLSLSVSSFTAIPSLPILSSHLYLCLLYSNNCRIVIFLIFMLLLLMQFFTTTLVFLLSLCYNYR